LSGQYAESLVLAIFLQDAASPKRPIADRFHHTDFSILIRIVGSASSQKGGVLYRGGQLPVALIVFTHRKIVLLPRDPLFTQAAYYSLMALISPSAGVSGSGRQFFINDPRWQLIERIIASPHLLKSSRLCGFLRFVTEETLAGRGEQLNEQRIGIYVFDRKLDYDSADDNIVRSHASRLRQRLEAYFLAEGRDETLRVELRYRAYPRAHIWNSRWARLHQGSGPAHIDTEDRS
jgi:hypothetical protein